jgi:branched-chain amino acid transport system permease protein
MTFYIRLLWGWINDQILAIPGRMIAVVFFVLLLVLPLITKDPYYLRILTLTAIFSIFAASWDLLAGFTGQLNLGHALFFGVAAYVAVLLNIHLRFPPWLTIPVGGIAAVLAGLFVGIPALRLRGFYLGLVTLSFPIILTGIIFVFPDFTGGELGLSGITRLSSSRTMDYLIVVSLLLVSILLMWKFTDARSKIVRIGIILHAIREDEIAARTCGINTTRYKFLAFAVSGFFAGVAGGLYAHVLGVAGPSTLELFFSFQAILWTIFGGLTTIYGAVAGVYILYPFLEFLNLYPMGGKIRFVVLAIILISTLLFMPEGVTVWVRDKIEVTCPRCKLINIFARRHCRACHALLHLKDREFKREGGERG